MISLCLSYLDFLCEGDAELASSSQLRCPQLLQAELVQLVLEESRSVHGCFARVGWIFSKRFPFVVRPPFPVL